MAIIHNLIARFRADTGAFDQNVNKSRTHMTRFGKDVQRMGKQLLAVAGIGGGIYMVVRGLKQVVSAAIEQQKAETALRAAVGDNISQFKDYAATLQGLTIYGDELILAQMAYGKNLGITTDKLKEAAKAAIGLAAKYSIDLATSMMLVGRASQGQTQMLTRYGIVLNQTLTVQQKFDELLRIGADSFTLAEKAAKDAAGTFRQFKNAVGDVAEDIGGPVITAMTKGARWILDYRKETERLVIEWKVLREEMEKPIVQKWMEKQIEQSPLIKAAEEYGRIQKQQMIDLVEARGKQIKSWGAGTLEEQNKRAIELDKWISEFHAKNWAEQAEKQYNIMRAPIIKLEKEQLEATERSAANQMRIYTDIARGMAGEWSNAFDAMLFEGKKFADAMTDMLRSVMRMVTQIIMYETIAKPIAAGMMGMPVSELHLGGIVGQTSRTRRVPAMAFAGAPRLHGGFAGDEYPAILQRGEQVIPRGGGGGMAPTINVFNNDTGVRLKSEGEPMYDGKQWVIRIVAEDIQQGGTLRKMVRGIR